eukprot:8168404-Alexandrium_andersonii.AAC.1
MCIRDRCAPWGSDVRWASPPVANSGPWQGLVGPFGEVRRQPRPGGCQASQVGTSTRRSAKS